jgi:hypothetical protein
MAGKKISELQALTEITGQEMIPVARDGQNYSVLSSLLQSGDATKLNDYMYDISLLMGKMAVRGTKGASKTTQPYGFGYYHIDGSYTELGSLPAVITVIVDENKVYHFDIGYYKYTNIADDAAVLVLFDENNKVLTAIPWAEGGFHDKYLVFTSAVKKYGVTYSLSPVIKPYPPIVNETYEIQDINDVLSNMNTEIEANTASISAVESNININQGNRALYVAAGAVYNEQTGFYELNELTDITEEQMRNIYVYTSGAINQNDLSGKFSNLPIRTNLPFKANSGSYFGDANIGAMFVKNHTIEVINIGSTVYANRIGYAFAQCEKLRKILTVINLNSYSLGKPITTLFQGCILLEYVRIQKIRQSISFSNSRLLSLESLQYLITNADNALAITVTVHADVYAKIQDETQTEWHALIASAQEKQITFATA